MPLRQRQPAHPPTPARSAPCSNNKHAAQFRRIADHKGHVQKAPHPQNMRPIESQQQDRKRAEQKLFAEMQAPTASPSSACLRAVRIRRDQTPKEARRRHHQPRIQPIAPGIVMQEPKRERGRTSHAQRACENRAASLLVFADADERSALPPHRSECRITNTSGISDRIMTTNLPGAKPRLRPPPQPPATSSPAQQSKSATKA